VKIQNCTNQGPGTLHRGDNYKNTVRLFKNLLKNQKARKAEIYIKASLYGCTNHGPRGQVRPQWGEPFYMCLYWKKSLKIFFRTSNVILIKLDTNHP
jgi:hypothetical protein